jgi:hypothetical protein
MSSTAFSTISVVTGLGIAALSFFLGEASPLNYAMLVLAIIGAFTSGMALIMHKREAARTRAIVNAAGQSMLGGL